MKIAADEVIHLLHHADQATLATQSLQMPGYPYASVVPCILDEAHCPILLISALAEHTKNVLADPRTSLSVVQADADNVQAAARVSIQGDCERFEPSAELVARYLRYLPEAEDYLALDFMFFRMQAARLRFISGPGRMGWLESDDWRSVHALSAADEIALLSALQTTLPDNVQLLGADRYGIDCTVSGLRVRQAFGAVATSIAALDTLATQALVALTT
ncbi:pyridoxamine 5'-phosphate oxidase family protein [Uliginosibacterium sp. H3]|uniref:Pyridoxamine 5'-phosphate oxidase family protein n=1 Tax=Uliginosibacterium silvisoli TaxID=3114758 RepID=A0ABU6K0K3_9RHOO|nr:pyridoxamine 5'-phosphate oxidase family protein [Uliginosibacterium sp. H3]